MARIGTDIGEAQQILQRGGLVAIPTETVYGLAANALNPEAVARIFEAKKRPSFDPLIVHISGIDRLSSIAMEVPAIADKLARAFWPGPLTILLPKRDLIPDIVTSGMPDVAVRVPNNTLTLSLLRSLPFPLVAPSANPFGYISPTRAQHVMDQLEDKVDYILDGGPSEVGLESTIVGFPDGTPTIYRMGGLEINSIEAVIGETHVMPHSASNPKAPGMLKSHYAPHTPFRLMEEELQADSNAGYLTFSTELNVPRERLRILSPAGDLREAAKNLFGYMRELDSLGLEYIFAETVPDRGLGKAINDRLRRAAAGS